MRCSRFMNSGMNTIDKVLSSLISTCKLGPAVSFIGSPTVSPTTEAWCAGEFLPPVLILPILRMRTSEVIIAMMPAMGASQKTNGD